MKIFLVRHGEAVDDIEDCYGGISDFVLTEDGRETAKELAIKLADSNIKVLYSSPYKRAYETAKIVGRELGCEVEVVQNLRERNSYGVLSGVNKAKAKEIFAHIIDTLAGKPGDYYSDEIIPGEEPRDEFNARVKCAFDEIVKAAEDHEAIGIVTHGNVTRSIYRHILGVEGKLSLGLLAITVLEYEPASIKIEHNEGVTVKSLS